MDPREFRVLIKHCYLAKKNTTQTREWLHKHYGDAAPAKSTICRWFSDFKFGRTNIEDAARCGRPFHATVPENIKKTKEFVLSDRKIRAKDIGKILKISENCVRNIINEHLQMQKLCANWVPQVLSNEEKQERLEQTQNCLKKYEENEKEFLERFVTMGSIRIFYNEELQAKNETGPSEPKQAKLLSEGKKILMTVFWDSDGIIFVDYFEDEVERTAAYYKSLMEGLNKNLQIKRPEMLKKGVYLHIIDELGSNCSEFLKDLPTIKYDLLIFSSNSSDLCPFDYYLYIDLKKMLNGKKFSSKLQIMDKTDEYFDSIHDDYFKKGIETLPSRWTKCISLEGDYIEV